MKEVRTIGVIQALNTFTKELKRGLGYSGASWWKDDNNLYILDATKGDMTFETFDTDQYLENLL